MEFGQMMYILMVFLVLCIHALTEELDLGQNDAVSNQTANAYSVGVRMGIISPEKYSLESFEQDERHIFKDLYEEYISWNDSQPINYQEWLIMNNYGLRGDTQEFMFQKKLNTRSKKYKRRFMRTVSTGDILISEKSRGGEVGHAAIMISDYWVLEMCGGKKWKKGITSNNRQISKSKWYDDYCSEWTTVYRFPDRSLAEAAAYWADRNYYNPHGGSEKTIHVTYKITPDFRSTNPSYSSKLVLQAYYFTSVGVVRDPEDYGAVIVPSNIPAYFMAPYKLEKVGKF